MIFPPYNQAATVATGDTSAADFPLAPDRCIDALYVGGAGVVAGVLQDGSVQNFTCVAGQILPVKLRRVNTTNTTATLMVALWRK